MKGFVYILKCNDDSYYTGSTIDIDKRLNEHQNGFGANHTKKRLPVVLVYYEEFQRIDEAFIREKQIQGWSRRKKEALINGKSDTLPALSKSKKKGKSMVVEPVETTLPGNTGFDELSLRAEDGG